MKLRFDENLSPRLVAALADIFPDSAHVDRIGLGGATDDEVWEHALKITLSAALIKSPLVLFASPFDNYSLRHET